MTEAQWKKMNGEVKSWNLDEPMKYADFKEMAPELQAEYIRRLNSRFGVGTGAISEYLFHLSNSGLSWYLHSKGIKCNVRGKKLTKDERAAWEAWLRRQPVDHIPEPEKMVEEESVVEEQPAQAGPQLADTREETNATTFGMDHLEVEWCGKFDAVAFVEQLRKLPFPDGQVKVRLEVNRV
jgi:hypothetical protein